MGDYDEAAERVVKAARRMQECYEGGLADGAKQERARWAKCVQWLFSGDVGSSSRAIWAAMLGIEEFRRSYPLDPDDFGRCYRLLKTFPEWRDALPMSSLNSDPCWRDLIAAWPELEKLYEAEPFGKRVRTYDAMRRIRAKHERGLK